MNPSKCVVCNHPDKDEIDAELAIGTPYRVIHAHHGVAVGSLHRHKTNHPPVALAVLHRAIEPGGDATDIDARLLEVVRACHEVRLRAEEAGSVSQVVDALREERQANVALGAWQMEQERMAIARRAPQVVNVMATQEWKDLRDTLAPLIEVGLRTTNTGVANAPSVPVYPEVFAAWKRIVAAVKEDS